MNLKRYFPKRNIQMKCEHTNSRVKRYSASPIIRAIQISKTIPKPVRVTTIKTKDDKDVEKMELYVLLMGNGIADH